MNENRRKSNIMKFFTRSSDDEVIKSKREKAQTVNFSRIQELLERNVTRNVTKSFTQYTKDLVKTYINSPNNNQETLREISRFLCRNSMLYQKLLMYYASMPLFNYEIIQINDFSKEITPDKALKNYQKVLERFESFDFKKEGFSDIYFMLRDGLVVSFNYDSEADGSFFMPLDTKYVRIYGKTPTGEWIVYFDASYFDVGNNSDFINGADGQGTGAWDEVFVQGYNDYKTQGRDFQWFRLPPEKTKCLICGSEDQFLFPLPFFLPIFTSLLDLLDLEQILKSKTELENYKLIVSKIPTVSNSDDVDDFSISLELAEFFNNLLAESVPDLVGVAYSPMDIDTVSFENSNNSRETDALEQSIQNLFQNAGCSQLVVSGGSSTNSIGLNHAIRNDESTCWVWVDRIEAWYNKYINENFSSGYKLKIHRQTWYNQDEYITRMKDAAALGGSALSYLTACGDTPYFAIQKLRFENAIGIKDLMIPLQSAYNGGGSNGEAGRPEVGDNEISDAGAETRDKGKNEGTKAGK